jgi:hypothetical protein
MRVLHPCPARSTASRPLIAAGTPLFALDIHPSGGKLATCGSDQTVKIWNTAAILHERLELDQRTPKLLATLSDHCGAVNTVQFSRSGKYIASGSGGPAGEGRGPPAAGSPPPPPPAARLDRPTGAGPQPERRACCLSGADDQVVLIHEMRPGKGQAAFGGGGGGEANIENWKTVGATACGLRLGPPAPACGAPSCRGAEQQQQPRALSSARCCAAGARLPRAQQQRGGPGLGA